MNRKHRKHKDTGKDMSLEVSPVSRDKAHWWHRKDTGLGIVSRDTGDAEDLSLWWVQFLQDWARPVVAAVVLVMSFPGEHYLAHMAGWVGWLSWGMPIVLTLYAGVAAVVATKRPRGSSGKTTAVLGAGVAITLSMAAQPFAHLFQSGWVPGDAWTYRQTEAVVVSCIPALVFGHLLHLAAAPAAMARRVQDILSPGHRDDGTSSTPDVEDRDTVPAPSLPVSRTAVAAQGRTKDIVSAFVPEDAGRWDTAPEIVLDSVPAIPPERDRDTAGLSQGFGVPEDTLIPVRDIQAGSVSAYVLRYLEEHGTDAPRADIRDAVLSHFAGQDTPKDDAIFKAITRARKKLQAA